MGRKDITSINYFKDKSRIADLLNVYLYQGQEVIKEKDITELNPILAKSWWNNKDLKSNVNITDVLFEVAIPAENRDDFTDEEKRISIIVSIQNQSDIRYIMPVRVINGDANGYYLQWKKLARKHKRERQTWADEGEFLSKFKKDDRLKPILTIVIYFGKKNWDGAQNLKQIEHLDGCPLHIQKKIQDYSINLIEVVNFSDTDKFTTDLKEVFGFLQNNNSKQELEKYIQEHRDALINLEEDAYDLICVMSDMSQLQELKKEPVQKGEYDMCRGIEEMIEEEARRKLVEGENLITTLYEKLYYEGRIEDMKRAFTDQEYRRQLMTEYGLQAVPYKI